MSLISKAARDAANSRAVKREEERFYLARAYQPEFWEKLMKFAEDARHAKLVLAVVDDLGKIGAWDFRSLADKMQAVVKKANRTIAKDQQARASQKPGTSGRRQCKVCEDPRNSIGS
jgi:predicted choloylglycine hydrolase